MEALQSAAEARVELPRAVCLRSQKAHGGLQQAQVSRWVVVVLLTSQTESPLNLSSSTVIRLPFR